LAAALTLAALSTGFSTFASGLLQNDERSCMESCASAGWSYFGFNSVQCLIASLLASSLASLLTV